MRSAVVPRAAIATNGAPSPSSIRPKNSPAQNGIPHVAAIVCVERKVFTRIVSSGLWDWTTKTALYVSNTTLTAVNAADAIRGHWKIETTSHYSRDVTFGEDKSRIRSNPGVFARLRSFAFNILKSSKTSTLCQDRYRAALAGINNLLEVLAIP
jgi:predicted transposase YbfD/YdcC